MVYYWCTERTTYCCTATVDYRYLVIWRLNINWSLGSTAEHAPLLQFACIVLICICLLLFLYGAVMGQLRTFLIGMKASFSVFSRETNSITNARGTHNHAPNPQKVRAMLEEVTVVENMVNSCSTQMLKPQHVLTKVCGSFLL